MTPHHSSRPIAACLALLLAAALACSPLARPAAPFGAPLTQAAATITAAANVIATSRAAATLSLPSPTAPPPTSAPAAPATVAPTAAATAAASATSAPTTAADTATPAAAATGTPATAAAGVVVDPCSLASADEAQALLGVPVGKPQTQNGGCLIADAATGKTSGLIIFAVPGTQEQYFVQQYGAQLTAAGVKLSAANTNQLNADEQAGDTVATVNDLAAIAVGQAKFHAVKVDGLGSAALWAWNSASGLQVGNLVAAQPGALVALVLVGPKSGEADAQKALTPIVARILGGLPASFTVNGLQVAGSAPAIDPCSLATPTDAETILGTKAVDGAASQGYCTFYDAATHKYFVRVFAFPAGASAAGALNLAGLTVLIGNTAAQNQLATDLAAGDLVTAVKHMAAAGHGANGAALESVDGLGDASVFFITTIGSERVAYVLAAKPDLLMGVTMLLKPGDDAATKAAAVALATNILQNLPDKFTVTGVP